MHGPEEAPKSCIIWKHVVTDLISLFIYSVRGCKTDGNVSQRVICSAPNSYIILSSHRPGTTSLLPTSPPAKSSSSPGSHKHPSTLTCSLFHRTESRKRLSFRAAHNKWATLVLLYTVVVMPKPPEKSSLKPAVAINAAVDPIPADTAEIEPVLRLCLSFRSWISAPSWRSEALSQKRHPRTASVLKESALYSVMFMQVQLHSWEIVLNLPDTDAFGVERLFLMQKGIFE